MSIILIHPYPGRPEADVRLSGILSHALADREGRTIRTAEELDLRPGDRVLFALALDGAGQNLEYYRMLSRLRREPDLLEGCTAALIVDGPGELYTKSTAGELALAADMAGCALIGRPLVEGTGSLANFRVQAKNLGTDLMGAYLAAAQELVQRLDTFTFPQKERPELLVLHASSHHTSNTMALWGELQKRLSPRWQVEEIGLRNGTLSDCSGCPYRAACCKAKDSEKRKEIFVCWEFQNLRKNAYHNITTEEGKLLRCNRSIQAEGAFGQLKHNRNFKRFLTGGKVKVLAELLFLGLSQNIAHLLAKCNSGLQNLHLIQPKAYLNF